MYVMLFLGDIMNNLVKRILNTIENSGYMSYVVGGYVRDYIMQESNNYDVDIVTKAPVELLLDMFQEYNPKRFKYGTVKFKVGKYGFDIAQFRKEEYIDNKLVVTISDNIIDDVNRRDFTINSIYIDKNDNYVDYFDGVNDCKRKVIKFIGDPVIRMKEDPSRIYRLIYFKLKYNLECDEGQFQLVKDNAKELIDLCSSDEKRKYINKILDLNMYSNLSNVLELLDLYDYFFDNNKSVDFSNKITFITTSKFKYVNYLRKSDQKKLNYV